MNEFKSTYLYTHTLPPYLPTYLPTYLPACLPTYPPARPPTHPPPTYPPSYPPATNIDHTYLRVEILPELKDCKQQKFLAFRWYSGYPFIARTCMKLRFAWLSPTIAAETSLPNTLQNKRPSLHRSYVSAHQASTVRARVDTDIPGGR